MARWKCFFDFAVRCTKRYFSFLSFVTKAFGFDGLMKIMLLRRCSCIYYDL